MRGHKELIEQYQTSPDCCLLTPRHCPRHCRSSRHLPDVTTAELLHSLGWHCQPVVMQALLGCRPLSRSVPSYPTWGWMEVVCLQIWAQPEALSTKAAWAWVAVHCSLPLPGPGPGCEIFLYMSEEPDDFQSA